VEAARGDELPRVGREERVGFELARAVESLLRRLRSHVQEQRGNAGIGEMGGNLGTHGARAKHSHGSNCGHTRAFVAPSFSSARPLRKRSITWSACSASEYRRRLRIQLVAISSSAPNRTLAARVGLRSLRSAPAACPAAIVSRMMPR